MTATKLFILLYRFLIVSNLITTQPAPPAMPLIKVGGFARHRGVLAFFAFHPGCAFRQKHQEQSASPSVSTFHPTAVTPLPLLYPLLSTPDDTPLWHSWCSVMANPICDLWLLRSCL